jgi:RHS repeat-associated protein
MGAGTMARLAAGVGGLWPRRAVSSARILRSTVHGRRVRRVLQRGRQLTAAVLGPVLTAAMSLVAVTASAGVVAAVAVAKAPAAHAQSGPAVAVVLVNGESTAPETPVLQAAGFTVTQITPATLAAMSQSTFDSYLAVVIGDSSTSGSCSTTAPSTSSLGSQWQGWVTGNVAVLGTAPARPGTTGADALIADSVAYAAKQPTSGSSTGLYLSLNCGYATSAAGTAVSLLAGVDGIGSAGVTVNGSLTCSDTGMVNTWEADSAGTFGGLTNASLGTGSTGFPSPSCPVEEAFDSWPANFTAVGFDTGADATDNFTASDGVNGQPYVLFGTPPASAQTAELAPAQGGEVPAGTIVGGSTNPAAAAVSQATAGDPVNTEDGDFTESDTDVSIPTFGPNLEFDRTYDAQVAEQETEGRTPGAMGYGWTDNWASSLSAAAAVPNDIYTISGLATDNGNGGSATAAAVGEPSAVYVSGANVYFAVPDQNRVEEVAGSTGTQWGIAMTAGDVYTIAGSPAGTAGRSGNGTAASHSLLNSPSGVSMDNSGDLFIADSGNNRVVEIAASSSPWGNMSSPVAGDLYTVAGSGSGTAGDGADGTAATSSDLSDPQEVFIGGNAGGNLYVADAGNNRIQMVSQISQTKWGQSMSPYDVYTIAGSSSGTAGDSGDGGAAKSALLEQPADMTVDSNGNLYIADTDNCRVQEEPKASGTQWGTISMTANDIYTVAGRATDECTGGGNNKLATQSDLYYPSSVNTDTSGNLYIADSNSNCIKEVAAKAETQFGQTMTADYVYQVAGTGTAGGSGNGGPATSAELNYPTGVLYNSGNLYIADTNTAQIRLASGTSPYDITAAAGNGLDALTEGNGGPATTAALNGPLDVATDPAGDEFIADDGNNRIQEVAAASHTQFGIAMIAGDTYTVAGSPSGTVGDSGDGGPAAAALLNDPEAIALDAQGNLYIADTSNNRIQEVAATTHTQFGIAMTAGDIYTVAGSASGNAGLSGDGGAAISALLSEPESMTVDPAGDVYIADSDNNEIREVPVTSGTQWGQSMTAGDIYTIAGSSAGTAGDSGNGGAATSATLSGPLGVALDGAGNLYIADYDNNRIQEVPASSGLQRSRSLTKDDMYTIAGSSTGNSGYSGDGKIATSGLLDGPTAVAADAAGDIYVADGWNARIQEVPFTSGTQWGQQMTAGYMYTVAGNAAGNDGDSGDGGPATAALMNYPNGLSVDQHGNLYITDLNNNRIREVTATTTTTVPVYPAVAGDIVITQPGGSQIAFSAQTSGACTAPLVTAGGYCVQPVNRGATLTSNATSDTYTFVPSPESDTYTYSWDGQLISETDTAGNALTITYDSPAPGSSTTGTSTAITCPATAASCNTIKAASGRALVIGSNSAGLVTSVIDPMGRQWVYAYSTTDDLVSATDPMGNVTSYAYGQGSNGPLQASDLVSITGPNAQPGGPDAGEDTVNVYDNQNRVTSQTDPMGYTTTFDYAGLNQSTGDGVVRVADPDGNVTVDDYQQGTLAAESDWTGSTLTSENDYGPNTTGGTLLNSWTADADGNITSYQYNSTGVATTTTQPDGVGSQIAAVTRTVTPLDRISCESSYAEPGVCAQNPGPTPVEPGQVITPPAGTPALGASYALYDTDGNQLYSSAAVYPPGSSSAAYLRTTYTLYKGNSVTLPGTSSAVTCTYTPPSQSLPCAEINADGVVTQLGYNAQGDLTASSTPDGNGSQLAASTYGYDADGEQISATAPDGNLSGANVGNYTTTTAYNADGDQTSVTQGGGSGHTVTPRTTSYGYDADGNETSEQSALGGMTTTAYNADDEAVLTTDPLGNTALTCYDGNGNVTQTVPPEGVVANSLRAASCPTAYPAAFNPATSMLASDATMTTYNANGDATQVYSPAPAGQSGYETTSYTYDGDGNVLTETGPPVSGTTSQVTVNTYNSAGELAAETTGAGTSAAATTSYCYDPNGDETSVVMPDGNTSGTAPCETAAPWQVSPAQNQTQAGYQTTYNYDSSGDLVSRTTPATAAAPSGATTTATYDPAGNELTSTDPDGVTTTWTYTPQDLAASITYSGSSAHSVSYAYDADGDQTGMTDATGNSTYVYDPFGELTTATNGTGEVTSYGYNADGDDTSITYPLGSPAWAATSTVSFGYDNDDDLTSITDFENHQITIQQNADGMPATETLGSTGDTITTSYDPTDTPSAIAVKNATTTLQSFTYTDAPAGNILSETDTPSSPKSPALYTYDAQGRVTSMTAGTSTSLDYSFDPSGNLLTLPTGASGTYDNDSELTSSTLSGTTTSYGYNADGERLTAKQGSTTTSSGSWNGAGQLTAYSSSAGSMSAATYDGEGQRASVAGTSPQTFTWNAADSPELLMDSTNAYIYDGGAAPVEQVNLATGAVSYLISDSVGSVRGIVSSNGALAATTSYDVWGNPQTLGGLTGYTPFGFSGGYTDPDGLIYMVDRYYDPQTGQFISIDPDVTETLTPYAYAGGDPVNNSDPSGDYLRHATHTWKSATGVTISKSLCAGVTWVVTAEGCISGTYNQTITAGHETSYVKYARAPHNRVKLILTEDRFSLKNGVDNPFVVWIYNRAKSGKREFHMTSGIDYANNVKSWNTQPICARGTLNMVPPLTCTKYELLHNADAVNARLWAECVVSSCAGLFYPVDKAGVGFVLNSNGK